MMTATARARLLELRLRDGVTVRGEQWDRGDRCAVLVHDVGDDLDTVRPITRRFVDAGFTAIAVDRIGHGTSDDRADSEGGRPAALAADLVDLIDGLGLREGIYLVGVGEAAAGCLVAAAVTQPSLVALVSPRGLDALSPDVLRADRSPTLIAYGSVDGGFEAAARRLCQDRPGPALLVRMAVDTQAAALIEGSLGQQVANHIVGYARHIAPRTRNRGI